MAGNERKRQQKLQKKRNKQKKSQGRSKDSALGFNSPFALLVKQAAIAVNGPIHEALIPERLFETGMGSIIFSRKMPNGDIAASLFLLDVFCLGVKDSIFKICSEWEYKRLVEQTDEFNNLQASDPALVRKLVEDTEAYAKELGFNPHGDYQLAKKIFGDIDKSSCEVEFKFGKDGKPFYVAGPNDSPAKASKIIKTLTEKLGPDGFTYLTMMGDLDDFDELELIDDDEEFEDDEGDYIDIEAAADDVEIKPKKLSE